LPEHCTAPGLHAPEHTPPTHAKFMHATEADHVPVPLQDCTPLPLHCVCPGAHTPTQLPLTHVWFEHAAGAPQVAPALQV
jgi:hypothetical protein